MDDFLFRTYQLAQSRRQTRREDFASLCLGRQLQVDPDLADALLTTVAAALRRHGSPLSTDAAGSLGRWVGTRHDQRSIEVQAQVPARSLHGGAYGAADLVLRLARSSRYLDLVFEAKVVDGSAPGRAVPTDDQLRRYADAFPEARVLALVQPSAAAAVGDWPVLTWNDVLRALPEPGGGPQLATSRRELRDLMGQLGVGQPRLVLPDRALTDATSASERFHAKLEDRLVEALIQLFPNNMLRDRVTRALMSERDRDEPWEGWGVAFSREQPITGTRLSGAGLAVDAGPHHDELIWKLEVKPSNQELRQTLLDDPAWWPVRQDETWFVTELCASRGGGNLNKAILREVLECGRAAILTLHRETDAPMFHRGSGKVPPMRRNLSLPSLREGIRWWHAVDAALAGMLRQCLQQLCDDLGGSSPRWQGDAQRTPPLQQAGDRRVSMWTGQHLASVVVQVEDAGEGAAAAMARCADAWLDREDCPAWLEQEPDQAQVELFLDESTWRSPQLDECLLDLARAGLGVHGC